jgi:hypothetical protein
MARFRELDLAFSAALRSLAMPASGAKFRALVNPKTLSGQLTSAAGQFQFEFRGGL